MCFSSRVYAYFFKSQSYKNTPHHDSRGFHLAIVIPDNDLVFIVLGLWVLSTGEFGKRKRNLHTHSWKVAHCVFRDAILHNSVVTRGYFCIPVATPLILPPDNDRAFSSICFSLSESASRMLTVSKRKWSNWATEAHLPNVGKAHHRVALAKQAKLKGY